MPESITNATILPVTAKDVKRNYRTPPHTHQNGGWIYAMGNGIICL